MSEFSRFTVEMPEELKKRYEKSSSHMTALLAGARARQKGQSRESCPYDFNRAAGFFFAWSHGWIGMDNGDIVIKEGPIEESRPQ
jgi:ribosome modulation factor